MLAMGMRISKGKTGQEDGLRKEGSCGKTPGAKNRFEFFVLSNF